MKCHKCGEVSHDPEIHLPRSIYNALLNWREHDRRFPARVRAENEIELVYVSGGVTIRIFPDD